MVQTLPQQDGKEALGGDAFLVFAADRPAWFLAPKLRRGLVARLPAESFLIVIAEIPWCPEGCNVGPRHED